MSTVFVDENIKQYVATSGQTEFPFPFKIFSEVPDEDLKVYLSAPDQTWDESGTKVDPSDYSIAISTTGEGGTVTLVTGATIDYILTIVRDLPSTRTTDYGEAGIFTGESVDTQLDKLTILTSQNKSKFEERGLHYPNSEVIEEGQTNIPKLPPNYIWKANGSGNIGAAECKDEAGCSTLRSELASQTEVAPGTDNVGMYDPEDKVGKTLTDYLEHLRPQKDDIAVVKNAADETKKVLIDASGISTGTERTIIMPDTDVDLGIITVSGLPRGYIDGFELERHGSVFTAVVAPPGTADTNTHDLDIKSATPIIKDAAQTWVDGSGQTVGGMAASITFSPNTGYYVAALVKPTGEVNMGFDLLPDFSNLLATPAVITAGYTKVRYLGKRWSNSVPNFRNWKQTGDRVDWLERLFAPPTLEYEKTGFIISTVNYITLKAPPLSVATFEAGLEVSSGPTLDLYFSTTSRQTNQLAQAYMVQSVGHIEQYRSVDMLLDISSQLYVLSTVTNSSAKLSLECSSFVDRRGRQ